MVFFVDPSSWSKGFVPTRQIDEMEHYITAGSLAELVLEHRGLEEDDVRSFGRQEWLREEFPPTRLVLRPRFSRASRGKSLKEQVAFAASLGCSILTPYEIACLARKWAELGRRQLFEGRIRTEIEVVPHVMSHLPLRLTVTASYDEAGTLRLGKENPEVRKDDLGVLMAIRRPI